MLPTTKGKRMEAPLLGLHKKAERHRKLFFEALKDDQECVYEENVSLESAFHRFLSSPDVVAYYSLVPLIADLLQGIKSKCGGGPDLSKQFDILLRETSNKCIQFNKQVMERMDRINDALDEIEEFMLGLISEALLSRKKQEECDMELITELLKDYWAKQRESALSRNTGMERFTQSYVMQKLMGFSVSEKGDPHDERWEKVVWEWLSERDHYHLNIIRALDATQSELDELYLNMDNEVTFKSLVILTMWRFRRDKGVYSFREILDPDAGEDHEWMLAYGTFLKDYRVFIEWHQDNFEGSPVHLNLFYIDFEASATSEAARIDLANHSHSERSKHKQHARPFAALFAHHKEPLCLSYMVSPTDNVKNRHEKIEATMMEESNQLPNKKKSRGLSGLFI